MPDESADDIERDIERSRAALAQAVDQLAYRADPKRIANEAKQGALAKVKTPQGQAALGVAGVLLVLVIVRRIRKN